jgi:hypothetical protein
MQSTLVQIIWARPGYMGTTVFTPEAVLAGRGFNGSGVPSP